MIRLDAGMPTARFVRLVWVPERSYRRWQQRQRQGWPLKGPWPAPARDRVEPVAIAYADRFPAGAGTVIPPDSTSASIRDAAATALTSENLRAGAARMAATVAGYNDGAQAVHELTTILMATRTQHAT